MPLTKTDPSSGPWKKKIDDLSWGFELYDTFTLKHGIAFTLNNAGHQFIFIYRTTPDVASRINARIDSDPLLVQLLRDDKIKTVNYDDLSKPQRPAIKDTSDPSRTMEMQHA